MEQDVKVYVGKNREEAVEICDVYRLDRMTDGNYIVWAGNSIIVNPTHNIKPEPCDSDFAYRHMHSKEEYLKNIFYD